MNTKYKELFKPIKIGSVEIPNRVSMVAMGVFTKRFMNYEDSSYTKEGADYYIERAKGGAGLIITGLNGVVGYTNRPYITKNSESYVKNMKYLMDGVHKYGSKLFVQLTAGVGRTGVNPKDPIAPSPIPNVWDPMITHRSLRKEEIKKIVDAFGQGALNVKNAGGDGVEIHAIHEGYLLDQFAIANFNYRNDEYGGSLENRLRFAVEILHKIKETCGQDFQVVMRYSVRSYIKALNRGALPGEEFVEYGRNMEESLKVAKLLEEAGYDALDCDNGSYDAWYWAHPPVYMPKACNLEDTIAIKKAVSIPVICSGRFDNPELANECIKKGEIDILGMGRPFLADPYIVQKFYNNKADDVRPCISCHMGCFGRLFKERTDGNDISCALNPACGREKELAIEPAEEIKRVLIVGGGIGGMEAARVSALRGHTVEIHEKTGELGGALIAASAPDFKEDDRKLLTWYEKQLKDLNVRIYYNSFVDKEFVDNGNYDEIFVATGADERKLNMEGIDRANVYYAKEALLSDEISGDDILVVGGGLTGCEIAYDLSKKGKKVTIIEACDTILNVYGLSAANYNMLMDIIDYYNIRVMKNTSLKSYDGETANLITTIKNTPNIANRAKRQIAYGIDGVKREVKIKADSIVISVGYVSNASLYKEIKNDNVYLIGDAKVPTNVLNAVWTAYEIARKI